MSKLYKDELPTSIEKLYAGTALEHGEFMAAMRHRAEEFGHDIVAIVLDPEPFKKQSHLPENAPRKDGTYPTHLHRELDTQLIGEYKRTTQEQFEDVDIYGNVSPLAQTLRKASFKDNESFHDKTLNTLIDDRASNIHVTFNGRVINAITPQTAAQSLSDYLCHTTGWQQQEVQLTATAPMNHDLKVFDHEMGHAVLNHKLKQKPLAALNDDKYSKNIHECTADAMGCISAIHDGAGLETFDQTSLKRLYNGVMHGHDIHFTCATLNHLKERVCVEHIQSLSSKEKVADYVLKMTLGSKEEDIKPAILSRQAFHAQCDIIKELSQNMPKIQQALNIEDAPTPLELEMLLSQIEQGEVEDVLGVDPTFLERYALPHKDTLVHLRDVERELTSPKRFEDPTLADQGDPFFDFALNDEACDFEKSLQAVAFPTDDEGYFVDLSLEERLYNLNRYARSLDKSQLTTDEQALLEAFQDHIEDEMEHTKSRDEIETDKASPLYVFDEDSGHSLA